MSDEPTTAAEMALMEELRRLVEAAGESLDQEQVEGLESDVLRVLMDLRALIDRTEQIGALRQAKGRPALARESAELLTMLYERVRALREQLEALYE